MLGWNSAIKNCHISGFCVNVLAFIPSTGILLSATQGHSEEARGRALVE
jgi:hypothetical protein